MQAREAGWSGRIALIGDEVALPYHRPPLSKAYLAGTASLDSMALKAREATIGEEFVGHDRERRLASFTK